MPPAWVIPRPIPLGHRLETYWQHEEENDIEKWSEFVNGKLELRASLSTERNTVLNVLSIPA